MSLELDLAHFMVALFWAASPAWRALAFEFHRFILGQISTFQTIDLLVNLRSLSMARSFSLIFTSTKNRLEALVIFMATFYLDVQLDHWMFQL